MPAARRSDTPGSGSPQEGPPFPAAVEAVNLVELEGVGVRGADQVLHDITLAIGEREFVAVVGSHGAGKSALLQAIAGVIPVTGRISFEGELVTRSGPAAMARLGVAYVPQGRGSVRSLSVLDNLRLGAWTSRGSPDNAFANVFELFPGLYDLRHRAAGRLSAAEQQTLGVARALMAKPRLLLVDEPSLGVAPGVAADLVRVLGALHARGTAIVVADQHPLLALAAADRGFVLDRGRLVREGAAAELAADESLRELAAP